MVSHARPVAERLAEKTAPGEGGCIVFTAARNLWGYGRLKVGDKTRGAHGVAWGLANGPIPNGLHVLHRCDNPPCVNPDHLFLGTNADNMADKARKGRCVLVRPHAKVTEADVATIRARYAAGGVFQRELASEYGLSRRAVGVMIQRKTWAACD